MGYQSIRVGDRIQEDMTPEALRLLNRHPDRYEHKEDGKRVTVISRNKFDNVLVRPEGWDLDYEISGEELRREFRLMNPA